MIQYIGVLGPYILLVLSGLYLWMNSSMTLLTYFAVGTLVNNLINYVFKTLFKQSRPTKDLTIENGAIQFEFGLDIDDKTGLPKRVGSDKYGMPSGHAQNVAFVLMFMYQVLSNYKSFWYLFIIFMISVITVVQRVAYYHHTIFQVVVGFILGSIMGHITYSLAKKRIRGNLVEKEDDGRIVGR